MRRSVLGVICLAFPIFSAFPQVSLVQQLHRVFAQLPEAPRSAGPQGKVVRPGLFQHTPPLREIYAASTGMFAGMREGALYVRSTDPESIHILAQPRNGWKWDVEGALFSPDGSKILVKQIDERQIPPLILHLSTGDTITKTYSRAGEPVPVFRYYVVTVSSGDTLGLRIDADLPYQHSINWDEDGKKVRLIVANRTTSHVSIVEADATTGKIRTVLSEDSPTNLIGLNLLPGYDGRLRRQLQVAYQTETFVWQSERSNFNQLYLYDHQGILLRPLTNASSNGIVDEVLYIHNGWIYFIGTGDTTAYFIRQLYRTSLKNPKIELLAPGRIFPYSVNGDTLQVLHSSTPYDLTLDQYVDGKHIGNIFKADLEFLKEMNFAPEYIQLATDDGSAKLNTYILKPSDFDPERKYPVIEHIYGAAFTNEIPESPLNMIQYQLQQLANQGFIVVVSDTRGTPGYGKHYQDYSYGRMGQLEISDHVYVLETLARERPFMDVSRVGIEGHSWGGYYALRAIIERPDVYKAAHLSAPGIDLSTMRIPVEIYMGCLPEDCPEAYLIGDNSNKLDRIQCPVQIIHGTADDDVPIEESYGLIEKMNAIGYTDYRFIELPGANHIVMKDRDWLPKMISFFKEVL